MKTLLLGTFISTMTLISIYILVSLSPAYNNIEQNNIHQLIDLSRKSGMLRYQLAVMTLYPNVDTDRLDSAYNASLKNDSIK